MSRTFAVTIAVLAGLFIARLSWHLMMIWLG
jgi:hypothetical protein